MQKISRFCMCISRSTEYLKGFGTMEILSGNLYTIFDLPDQEHLRKIQLYRKTYSTSA
jgi:hypothetical protein